MFSAAAAQQPAADYQRPGSGARGVGTGDWLFVPNLPSVFMRARPEYDPTGVQLGAWVLRPEVSIGAEATDNVFSEENDKDSDITGVAQPAFRLQSNWSTHMLGIEGDANFEQHLEETSENQEEGGGSVFGRLDITGADTVFASAGYRRIVEDRDDPDDEEGELTEFDRMNARIGYIHEFSRLILRFDAQGRNYNYLEDFDDDRDRNELGAGLRLTYAWTPRITPFVAIGYGLEDYEDAVDDSGVDRDSMQYTALVGANFLITEILSGELALGVEHTTFDEASFDSTTTPAANGRLIWNITPLTSIIARARYYEDVTTQAGASSKTVLSGGVRLEQEVLSNLLMFGEIGYRNDNYDGFDRNDDRFEAGLGGEFLLNRNVSFFAEYSFEHRESDVAGFDFTKNTIFIGTRLQY
jgi:hypothetical protein